MQNDFEERERDGYTRKNEIDIIKKIASKLFVVLLLASVFIGILTVIPEEVRAETWSIETVDSDGYVGRYTSIALDSNSYPHISYFDETNRALKYAKWTGTGWSIETIDSDSYVGRYTSIALDSNVYPHISYYDDANQDLKYVKWTGTGWRIETVDSEGYVGRFTSIALDNNGYPHISYFDDTNKALKYAKLTGTGWSIETVDSDDKVGRFTSIALDSNGYPHISYFDDTNKALKYVKWNGIGWSSEIVDSEGYVGGYSSMALSSRGYPHISYCDEINKALKYAKLTGTEWSIETVDSDGDVGKFTSIVLDSSNYPHISYFDDINKNLKYAKLTGNRWSIETIDSDGDVGRYSSIAIDSNDCLHISYLDYSNRDFKYAKLMPDVQSSLLTLSAVAGDKYVDLSWTPPSDGGSAITEYKIYRGTSSGGESYHDSVSTTSYNDTTVTNGQTYYYHVTAINVAGESSPSNEVPAEPRGPPGSHQKLQASAGDGYVNLEWIEPDDDGGSKITKYNIYRGSTSGGETLLTTVGNVLTYTDKDVTNDRTYYYQVSAENSVGEGEKSNEVDANPKSSLTETRALLVTTPSAPLNFKASAGDGNVNLEWTEPSADGGSLITNYKIYRGTTSGGATRLETVSNVLSYTDGDVAKNQKYYYQVSAVNSAGEGERSDEAPATLIPGVSVPSAPRNLKATASDRVVNLNWHVPVDDGGSTIMEYQIYRGTSSDGESYLDSVSATTTFYTDTPVTNDLIYYYKVSAENSVGEGAKSNEASATPTSDVTTPTATALSDPSALKSSATPASDVTTPTAPQTSAGTPPPDFNWMIPLIVAIIGALGVIAAALINYFSSKKAK